MTQTKRARAKAAEAAGLVTFPPVDRTALLDVQLQTLIEHITDSHLFAPIRASAIIRQFLCDGSPLAVQIHNLVQQPLPFVALHKPTNDPLWFLAPSLGPDHEVCELRAQDYVHVRVAGSATASEADTVSVLELVKYIAHVHGGVHAQAPDEEHAAIAAILRRFPFLDTASMVSASMREIGRTLVYAMQPARETLMGLARFDGQLGVGVAVLMRVLELDVEGDVDIITVGTTPGVRLFIRDGSFRVIARSGGKKRMLRGPFVPVGDEFAVLLDVARCNDDLLIRVSLDGLESVLLTTETDDWSRVTNHDFAMQVGFSRYGRFEQREFSVVGAIQTAAKRSDLSAYLDDRIGRPGVRVLFDPGEGMERDPVTGSMRARDPGSRPSIVPIGDG